MQDFSDILAEDPNAQNILTDTGESTDRVMPYSHLDPQFCATTPSTLTPSLELRNDASARTKTSGVPSQHSEGSFRPSRPDLIMSSLPNSFVQESVDLFFGKIHVYLPVYARDKLCSTIAADGIGGCHCEVFMILAMTENLICNSSELSLCSDWLSTATQCHYSRLAGGSKDLIVAQTGVWLAFKHYLNGSLLNAYVLLGSVWSIVRLQKNKLVGNSQHQQYSTASQELELTVWSVYTLDCLLFGYFNFPVLVHETDLRAGLRTETADRFELPLVCVLQLQIPPRALSITYSTSWLIFLKQAVEQSLGEEDECYTALTPLRMKAQAGSTSIDNHLMRIHSLFRKLWKLSHAKDNFDNTETPNIRDIESELAQLRLTLPGNLGESAANQTTDLWKMFWLNVLMNTLTILTNYAVPSHEEREQRRGLIDTDASLNRCFAAAKQTLQQMKDTLTFTKGPLMNPHLLPSYFLCGHILILATPLPRRWNIRADLNILLSVLKQIGQSTGPCALMYHRRLEEQLELSPKELHHMRMEGIYGLRKSLQDIFPE